MPERQLLFKIFDGDREYVIYTDGFVEGFGDDPFIINCYPALQAVACIASYKEGKKAATNQVGLGEYNG